ncbi:MAG TPA: tRNA pseudouridine(13) synthase TruD [Gammaproteobacteria bacterium]|nr:tRNA pseudouridine(13) synthase TruD [Gammaproteobacteria bacterium]
MPDPTTELAHAFGSPKADAVIRAQPEEFEVEEVLRFEPAGKGGHVYLRIRKRGLNTRDVAKALARQADVRPIDVGFAGMKDRNAVATQWFSVGLAGRDDPDWGAINSDALEVLQVTRHEKKLRPGQLMLNRFRIVLRDIRGDGDEIDARLDRIGSEGVPNYFGPQRFGRNGANLDAARELFKDLRLVRDRKLKGIYLSAARAQVFNHVLSTRVAAGSWNRALSGEVLMFDDSRSRFTTHGEDLDADPRIGKLELHPTGPLWGRGSPDASGEAAAVERRAAAALSDLTSGLEKAGLKADRRALRLRVDALEYGECGDRCVTVAFSLRPGAFATAVLREVVRLNGPSAAQPG